MRTSPLKKYGGGFAAEESDSARKACANNASNAKAGADWRTAAAAAAARVPSMQGAGALARAQFGAVWRRSYLTVSSFETIPIREKSGGRRQIVTKFGGVRPQQ